MSNLHKKIEDNSEWTPFKTRFQPRMFIFEQEQELADLIWDHSISEHDSFSTLQSWQISQRFLFQIAARLEAEKEEDEFMKTHPFPCSAGFINKFKLRHGFCSQRTGFQVRSEEDEARISPWIIDMENKFEWIYIDGHISRAMIVNCDEICWLVFPDDMIGKGGLCLRKVKGGRKRKTADYCSCLNTRWRAEISPHVHCERNDNDCQIQSDLWCGRELDPSLPGRMANRIAIWISGTLTEL
jgi:hypothetical protein